MVKRALLGVGLLSLCAAFALAQSQDINDYVQTRLRDLRATVRQQTANQRELEKINKDFANSYRIKQMTARYKEPSKMRLESKVGVVNVVYIINGNYKHVSAGPIKNTDDISNAPGKRQSLMDFGILTPSFMKLVNAKFLRYDHEGGVRYAVFELTWANSDDTSKHIVWMDGKTHTVVKRQWYNQQGKLMATFYYKEPKEVAPGIWVPTRVEVYNAEGKLGGVTTYVDLHVNEGLPDSLFQF
ncbi:MAG: outer membrane lipoprotein-sorting protein [Chthonomonadetes bacterium]|nr:outer membrane lipoprotein-sorting protein [Chthonomonadetes bacterium]